MKDMGFDFNERMDRWLYYLFTGELIEAVRPTDIGCEIDTEKLEKAYIKSEVTNEV